MATGLTETIKAKKYVLNKDIVNITILPSDLELVEEELPPLKDEEYLVEAELFSIDINYLFMKEIHEMGSTMIGFQLAKIVESKNPNFPVGKRIVGFLGWRTHTILDPKNNRSMLNLPPYFVQDISVIPLPLSLGLLGPLGNMAYFSLMEICKPKAGETIVISYADHSVAVYVGQIAKIMGLKVIGLCQSDNWAQILKKLGFDEVIIVATNQKYTETLKNLTDKGIDCFYDLDFCFTSTTVMYNMNSFGRVALYGSIFNYRENTSLLSDLRLSIFMNKLTMEGFVVSGWHDRLEEGIQKNLQWFCEGKLRSSENVYSERFENMLEIFNEVLHERTFGPVIVEMEQSTSRILLCNVTFS